jgi:hypothetical protein
LHYGQVENLLEVGEILVQHVKFLTIF